MNEEPKRRSRTRKIFGWAARVICFSVALAMIDCSTGFFFRNTPCSIQLAKLKDGGTTTSVGFGYFLTYYPNGWQCVWTGSVVLVHTFRFLGGSPAPGSEMGLDRRSYLMEQRNYLCGCAAQMLKSVFRNITAFW